MGEHNTVIVRNEQTDCSKEGRQGKERGEALLCSMRRACASDEA